MKCLIVDDDKLSRTIVREFIKMEGSIELVAECESAIEVYKSLEANAVDILFLDVEMPGITGIELVKALGQTKPLIIFISAKKDYAADAFELNVVDFIVKPVGADRLLQAIRKAKDIIKSKSEFILPSKKDEFIFIRDSSVIRRLKISDIGYLEAQGDNVKIYVDTKVYSIHSSLKSVEEKVPSDIFFRVHRSFIVNVSKIDTVEGSTLIINKSFVPISDAYKASLTKRMQIL